MLVALELDQAQVRLGPVDPVPGSGIAQVAARARLIPELVVPSPRVPVDAAIGNEGLPRLVCGDHGSLWLKRMDRLLEK